MTTADWDPRDQTVLRDQRSAYDEMRERCPVAYSDLLGWSLFRYSDVLQAVGDVEAFSSRTKRRVIPNGMDPPQHTIYRRLLEPYFGPGAMESFEPRCRRILMDLLGRLLEQSKAELVSELAEPYVLQALCSFVGWPLRDWERLRDWIRANQGAAFRKDAGAGAAVAGEFAEYVKHQLERRRAGPGVRSDALSAGLLTAEVEGQPLGDDDIVSVLRNVMAGHGTTAAALGIVALHLAQDEALQERLRAKPALLPTAIDEILRLDDPLVALGRTATRDVEIRGRTIHAGERVSLMWISANRDDETFADPDTVRFDRDPTAHVVFGAGIHTCLGASLARLEIRVAVEELLAHTSRFILAARDTPERLLYPSNGLRALPVQFTKR